MSVERVDVESQGSPWKEEHISRYHFISGKVKDLVLLDIACGTGFGSALLLNSGAAKLYAADISDEAIRQTTQTLSVFNSDQWVCHHQDGTALTYQDNTFDMVTSFETIEHIPAYKRFLDEIFRVLKPGGLLVLSTPNALITNPEKGKPQNPYHVYEFEPDELIGILSSYGQIEFAGGHHVKESYGVAPFLPSFNKGKLTFRQRINFLYWRLALRLPNKVRNGLHKLFFGHSFYPDIKDYTFLAENLKTAHVQYLICRKK